MENFQTIEQTLENKYNNQVIARRISIWKGLSILVLGIAFYGILGLNWDTKSIVPPIAITLGTTISIMGLVVLLIRKKHFYSIENHQKLKTHELHFNVAETNKLVQCHTLDSFSHLQSLKRSISSGLTLKVLMTQDQQICFTQVIGFAHFEHIPLTEVKQLNLENTIVLSDFINR